MAEPREPRPDHAKRLRKIAEIVTLIASGSDYAEHLREAAAEVDRLVAENERLQADRASLAVFAARMQAVSDSGDVGRGLQGDLDRLRDALRAAAEDEQPPDPPTSCGDPLCLNQHHAPSSHRDSDGNVWTGGTYTPPRAEDELLGGEQP